MVVRPDLRTQAAILRQKWAGQSMSSGQYTQSNSVGGSTDTVHMQAGVY